MEWMLMPYRRYFDFTGRSRRKEFWMFQLFYWIIFILLMVLMFSGFDFPNTSADADLMAEPEAPGALFYAGMIGAGLFALGSFIPQLAVTVRRLHDQDKSGWLILLQFIPYIGPIIILVFMFLEGTRGENRFGPDPKDPNLERVFA